MKHLKCSRSLPDSQVHTVRPSVLVSVPVSLPDDPEEADGSTQSRNGGAQKPDGLQDSRGRKLSVKFAMDVEEQKLPRCLSDPGPNNLLEEEELFYQKD